MSRGLDKYVLVDRQIDHQRTRDGEKKTFQDHSCHWKYAAHILMKNSCEHSFPIAEREQIFGGETFLMWWGRGKRRMNIDIGRLFPNVSK